MLQAGQKYSHEKTYSREHEMTEAPTKIKGKIMVHVKENVERTHKISCAGFGKENQRQHVEFGKPLVRLAALPKERYINFVDAYLLCLGVFKRLETRAHEGARYGRSP